MAWIKIPAENHPLFHSVLPTDPRVTTINMFGGVAALVNGNMFGGLFARSALVKLGPEDYAEAMALDGSEPFDPMGTGRVMSNTVLLGESVMDEPAELRAWLRKAFEYTATLPPKKKKSKTGAAKLRGANASGAKATRAPKVHASKSAPSKHSGAPKTRVSKSSPSKQSGSPRTRVSKRTRGRSAQR